MNQPNNQNTPVRSHAAQTADNPQEHELSKSHNTAYDEALAGQEADGGESVLSGAPREGEAEQVHKVSEPLHPGRSHPPHP